LLAIAMLTQSYIDLEVHIPVASRTLNIPVVDLCALLLLVLAIVPILRETRRGHAPSLPGPKGYALFVAASLLSITMAMEPQAALYHMVRKPIFFYLAYGVAVSWWVARGTSPRVLGWLLLAWACSGSIISLASSIDRIQAGASLWHQGIEGLSSNHKAVTVALSGALPLLISIGRDKGLVSLLRLPVVLLACAAIVASASKTAMITGVLGVGLCWPRHRPISTRPKWVVGALVLGTVLAYYAPLLLESRAMMDAARSRHSLNERALEMFTRSPLVGSGSGMGVHYEQVTWPHYRVNGVDTHGVIQKVASETGLLGLCGYGLFVGSTGMVLIRRRREIGDDSSKAAMGTWLTLHANLLLSTETLSPTHWFPLAVAWGIAHRITPEYNANLDGPHISSPPRG